MQGSPESAAWDVRATYMENSMYGIPEKPYTAYEKITLVQEGICSDLSNVVLGLRQVGFLSGQVSACNWPRKVASGLFP